MTLGIHPVFRWDQSEVIRMLDDQRSRIDHQEEIVLRRMASEWLAVERRLQKDIDLLAEETTRRILEGETLGEQIIWRSQRFKTLQSQMGKEINKFNSEYALPEIKGQQRDFAMFGIDAANQAIQISLGPTTRSWNRINVRAVESMIGFAADGTPLKKLLARDYPIAVDGLMKALINGVARGQGPVQTARDMADGMGMGLERAMLIARTEMARAYRTGSTEQYRKSNVVTGFKRLVKKETACLACLMLDGEEFMVFEELTDHPRGKCTPIPIVAGVKPPQWQTGPEWFETLSEEEQIAKMGQARFDMWKSGQVKLSDFGTFTHSKVWGDAPAVVSLAELRRLHAPRQTFDDSAEKRMARHLANDPFKKSDESMPSGHFESHRVKFADGTEGVYKPDKRDLGLPKGEVMSYELSEKLGLHVVPTTVYRDNGQSSLQLFKPNGITPLEAQGHFGKAASYAKGMDHEDIGKMAMLDMLSANVDRHEGNVLFQMGGKLHAIDNGLAFTFGDADLMTTFRNSARIGNNYLDDFEMKPMILSSTYKTKLSELLDSGELVKLAKDHTLSENASLSFLSRARDLIDEWDYYFQDER